MPAPAAVLRPEASGPGIPIINPVTGLSTDYLNHFSEAPMALEMVRDMVRNMARAQAAIDAMFPE